MKQRAPYRTDIDGLRALAVLPVLLFHFNIPGIPGGFAGVDVFFVISGFVIARSILLDIEAGKFTIARFYFKRVRRILPALLFTIALTTLGAIALLLPPDLLDYGKSVMASAFFVANIYFWKMSGYFSPEATTKPLLHLWSLSVEEQYYIFAPIAFAVIHRFLAKRWTLTLGPVLLASFALSVIAMSVAPTANFFLLPTRTWELLAGALLFVSGRQFAWKGWLAQAASWCGAALLLGTYVLLNEDMAFPGWTALPPVLGTVLVIFAGSNPDEPLPGFNRLLTWRPFTLIGLISYSLYLVHWPIVALFVYRMMRAPTLLEAVGMIVVSLLIATFSWRYIEQPFRHISSDRLRRVLFVGAGSLAATACAGFLLVGANGLPGRMPDFKTHKIAGTTDWGGIHCFNMDPGKALDWSASACLRAHGPEGRVLFWGDSFAAHYSPGIVHEPGIMDADVYQYTFAGCPPILAYYSLARVGCTRSNARVPKLVRDLHIDVVVMSARWTDVSSHTIDELGATVDALQKAGARVIVVGQSPQFSTDIQRIDYLSDQMHEVAPKWHQISPTQLNRQIASAAGSAHFVNPLPAMCSDDICQYREGDRFFYSDYGHYARTGAMQALARYIAPAVREELHEVHLSKTTQRYRSAENHEANRHKAGTPR